MSSTTRKSTPAATPVVVRLPKKVVDAIDKAAKRNCRTRSGEIRSRLLQVMTREELK